ncbi:unnamed protein product, partial [Cladocopium goreaui]
MIPPASNGFKTFYAIPYYNGSTLDAADALAREGQMEEAVRVLFAGPRNLEVDAKSKYAKDEVTSDEVLYWSRSTAQWLPATVLGHNLSHVASKDSTQAKLWSYQLDVQPQAPPSLVLRHTDEKSTVKTPTAGYPRPRLVVPNTCPWPMARSPPCWQEAATARKLAPSAVAAAVGVAATPPSATMLPRAAVVAPEALHVTTRLPRHSLTSTDQQTLIATTELDALLTPTRSLGSLGTPTHSPSAQVRHCTPEPRETRRSSPVAQLVGPLASPTQRTRSPARQVLIPGAVVVAPPAIHAMAPSFSAAVLPATPVPPLPQAPAETVPVPGAATVVAPPAEPIKAEKTQGSGPVWQPSVIITVPSTKMLRPVGSRATVPMAGYCTPKEPMSPPRSRQPRARIQVMPPATPPRQKHRAVMPLGAAPTQPARPQSLLRAATSARSVEMLSPKDPQTPHLPMSQSLLVPSTRSTSPGRNVSPVRQMVPTLSQRTLHTQPALAVTPMTAPRSPLGMESRHLQSRSARPQLHQWGVPPEKWGIHFDQLLDLEQHQKFQRDWNTREVVSEIIWPETAGKGIG